MRTYVMIQKDKSTLTPTLSQRERGKTRIHYSPFSLWGKVRMRVLPSCGISLVMVPFFLLAGCSLAPKLLLPDTKPPEAFKEAAAAEKTQGTWKVGEPSAALPKGEWWQVFKDETLNKLETDAAAGNLPLQAMAARVKQARETAKVERASLFPDLDGSASFTRQKPSAINRGMAASTPLPLEDSYDASGALSYELDLFGRALNRRRAASADAETSAAMLESMKLALQADVAENYFILRSLDGQIRLLEKSVGLMEGKLDILKKRLAVGGLTELDTAQSTVELENLRGELQSVRQTRKEREHTLALLLGKSPSEFSLPAASASVKIPSIPPGMPSALLERRPDVMAAQHKLAAANARIGVARAAFFPSISLTGNGGFQSRVLGDLFEWPARSWALGPLVSIPIFSGGAATANSSRAKASYDEAVADYRQQVLVAFKDVEDSLSRLKTLSDRAISFGEAEKAAIRARELADKRYDIGDIGYLEAITARTAAIEAQRTGIEIRGRRLAETVRLIRALGGGWGDSKKPVNKTAKTVSSQKISDVKSPAPAQPAGSP